MNRYAITRHADVNFANPDGGTVHTTVVEAENEGDALDAWARTEGPFRRAYTSFAAYAHAHARPGECGRYVVEHARARMHIECTPCARTALPREPHYVTHEIVGGVSYALPFPIRCY